MKKLILLIIPILLVGCEAKSEEFAKTCTKEILSENIIDNEKLDVTYNNNDEVLEVISTRTYKARNSNGNIVIDGIKNSLDNYNNNLLKSKYIKITNPENKKDLYVLKYYFDVSKLKKEQLDELNIKKNSIKYFNKLKNIGYTCK